MGYPRHAERRLVPASASVPASAPLLAGAPGGAIDPRGGDCWYWRLQEDLVAAAQARKLARDVLARLELAPGLVDDGVAIVAELVANALVHGLPPVELQIIPGVDDVRLAVVDRGAIRPVWRAAGPDSLGGRGMLVVSAYADGNCGTAPAAYRSVPGLYGKSVWAVLPRRRTARPGF